MMKFTNLGEIQKSDTTQKTVFEVKIKVGRRIYKKVSREIDKRNNCLIHYPFYIDEKTGNIIDGSTITKIIFEAQNIPIGCAKKRSKGYRFTTTESKIFVKLLKDLFPEITILRFTSNASMLGRSELQLSYTDFERLQHLLKGNSHLYQQNNTIVFKTFANTSLGQTFQINAAQYNGGELANFLHNKINIQLSNEDKNELTRLIDNLDITSQETIVKTRKIVEKKQLESVIDDFDKLLTGIRTTEQNRQRFFATNPRIFSNIFGFPATIFQEQAYVGGKRIDNQGANMADFLYQNKLSDNVAIIEIKKASSKILSEDTYRGDDIFHLTKDLSGAINQIINQKYLLMTNYHNLLRNDYDGRNFQVLNPKCFVIIGKYNDLTKQQTKCFELFRNTNKDIEILTFDEVYEKMCSLLTIFNIGDE